MAELSNADFSEANLKAANLSNASLREANLSGADISYTKLSGADFTRANLSGANCEGTFLYFTTFAGANLKDAKGMDKCWYNGPCVLGDDALLKSGPLPAEFLRCCNQQPLSEEELRAKNPEAQRIFPQRQETLDRPIF